MEDLTKRQSAENMLEMLIQSLGYPDVFVKTEEGKVTVTVITLKKVILQLKQMISFTQLNANGQMRKMLS